VDVEYYKYQSDVGYGTISFLKNIIIFLKCCLLYGRVGYMISIRENEVASGGQMARGALNLKGKDVMPMDIAEHIFFAAHGKALT